METKVELIIINSRYNRGWVELVLVVDNVVAKVYGQFRTADEAWDMKKDINVTLRT